MGSSFEDKIDILSTQVEKASENLGAESSCFTIPLVAGIATPFVLALVLWGAKPKFVTKKIGDKTALDVKKLLQWTIIMSLIIWIGLYLYTYCQESGTSLFCLFKNS